MLHWVSLRTFWEEPHGHFLLSVFQSRPWCGRQVRGFEDAPTQENQATLPARLQTADFNPSAGLKASCLRLDQRARAAPVSSAEPFHALLRPSGG